MSDDHGDCEGTLELPVVMRALEDFVSALRAACDAAGTPLTGLVISACAEGEGSFVLQEGCNCEACCDQLYIMVDGLKDDFETDAGPCRGFDGALGAVTKRMN